MNIIKKIKENPQKSFALICADFYIMGLIFHAVPYTLPLVKIITPYFLLIFGAALLLASGRDIGSKSAAVMALMYAFTFAMEAAGVATGKVFGPYSYGSVLGLKLLDVPLVIGFNWVLIMIGLNSGLERYLPRSGYAVPVIAAAGAVLFDWIMEPAAIALGYWSWHEGVIPTQNYIAWFLIALVCGMAMCIFRLRIRSRLPLFYVAVQAVFFIVLRIIISTRMGM